MCGTYERHTSIADRHQRCVECGSPINLLITASTGSKGFEPHFDIGLGVHVTGLGDVQKNMRENKIDRRDPPSPGDRAARLDRIADSARRQDAASRRR